MAHSMTAFARQEQQESWGQICWELRSVNHRYLDIALRIPEEMRRLEPVVREKLQQQLKRGRIECNLYFQAGSDPTAPLAINYPLVTQLWRTFQNISTLTGNSLSLPNYLDILRWPGVLENHQLQLDEISDIILSKFDKTLENLLEQRQREGLQLVTLLEQRCAAITVEIEHIRRELPTILQTQSDALRSRLAELVELNSERVEQEIVILAQKMDVAEELDRMDAHLQEIRHTLATQTTVGRRLDFLVQELHREANTLGAKANHIYTTRHAVELKVLIEQMREQTQNIE